MYMMTVRQSHDPPPAQNILAYINFEERLVNHKASFCQMAQ